MNVRNCYRRYRRGYYTEQAFVSIVSIYILFGFKLVSLKPPETIFPKTLCQVSTVKSGGFMALEQMA